MVKHWVAKVCGCVVEGEAEIGFSANLPEK